MGEITLNLSHKFLPYTFFTPLINVKSANFISFQVFVFYLEDSEFFLNFIFLIFNILFVVKKWNLFNTIKKVL